MRILLTPGRRATVALNSATVPVRPLTIRKGASTHAGNSYHNIRRGTLVLVLGHSALQPSADAGRAVSPHCHLLWPAPAPSRVCKSLKVFFLRRCEYSRQARKQKKQKKKGPGYDETVNLYYFWRRVKYSTYFCVAKSWSKKAVLERRDL